MEVMISHFLIPVLAPSPGPDLDGFFRFYAHEIMPQLDGRRRRLGHTWSERRVG
jgi:hypothetical protein